MELEDLDMAAGYVRAAEEAYDQVKAALDKVLMDVVEVKILVNKIGEVLGES